MFDIVIREFFGMYLTTGKGLFARIQRFLRCWLSDGCYNVNSLEEILKELFGAEKRLFDADCSGVSGQKVAVTVYTLSDALIYIFSNYNGRAREKSYSWLSEILLTSRADMCKVINISGQRSRKTNCLYGKRKILELF